MNSRQEINRQIIKQLAEANERMGDQRFGQLLVNCDVTVDATGPGGWTANEILYHEESATILARVLAAGERIFNGRD